MTRMQRVVLLLLAAAVVLVAVLLIPALTDTGNEADDQVRATVTRTVTSGATPTATTSSEPERPAVRTIDVRGGKPRGGVQKLSFRKDETVTFVVTSDVADEVHVHGYDIEKEIPAGGSARVTFKAESEGIYEVELHGSGQQIASLHVNPA